MNRGKPKIPDFTEEQLDQVEKLAMYGLEQDKIAHCFNISKSGLVLLMDRQPALRLAMDRGYAKAEAEVSRVAYTMAVSGKSAPMTQFWLKCRARWKSVEVVETREASIEDLVNGATEKEVKAEVVPIKKAD